MTVVLVVGTRRRVGATTAVAALAAGASGSVAVVKPAQTGAADGAPGDADEVARLVPGVVPLEFARYPDPLPPHHAAWVGRRPALRFTDAVRRIDDLDAVHDLVLVDGAGGLLTPYDNDDRWTVLDLAADLHCAVLVVAAVDDDAVAGAAAAVTRLAEDNVACAGVIIGAWPAAPDLVARCAVSDLQSFAPAHRLAGALPEGLAAGGRFAARVRPALGPEWGGRFDSRAFVAAQVP